MNTNKLTIYCLKGYKNYWLRPSGGGGMAVVAAVDVEQAKQLARQLTGTKDDVWNTQFDNPDEVDVLPIQCDGEPRVLSWFVTGE